MPVTKLGPTCARRGCSRPIWNDSLCGPCWNLCRLFRKDTRMFAYEPVDGYRGDRDAVELPWDQWETEAGARGESVVDLFTKPDRPA